MPDDRHLLLVMRHGEAEAIARSDFQRPLTPAGREDVTASVRGLIVRGIQPGCIVASPLVRAQQTALLVDGILGAGITTWEEIAPDGEPDRVAARIEGLPTPPLLVTHQPFVGRLIEYMTDEETPMATANIACVSYEVMGRGCGRLDWTINPRY